MPLCFFHVNADLYAGDTTLYANSVNILQNNLSHDLKKFSNWCNENNLVINTKKANGQKLECVDNLKILGLIILKTFHGSIILIIRVYVKTYLP